MCYGSESKESHGGKKVAKIITRKEREVEGKEEEKGSKGTKDVKTKREGKGRLEKREYMRGRKKNIK